MRRDETVLVVGGAGYVGSHVVLALLDAGYRAVVVDDLSSGRREAVPAGAILIEADAANPTAVRAAIERYGVGAAVHLAAGATAPGAPSGAVQRDLAMTEALAWRCVSAGVSRFVFTSSAAVHAAGTANAYGAGKLEAERRVREAFAGPGRACINLRCFNVAGADPKLGSGPPGGSPSLVAAACETALGLRGAVTVFGTDHDTADGTCVRDYVHVTDVAAAHVLALEALERDTGNRTFDCGTGRGRSVLEVLAEVGRRAGAPVPLMPGPRRDGDVPVSVAQPGAIATELGWRTRHSALRSIVSTAYAWTESRAARIRCSR